MIRRGLLAVALLLALLLLAPAPSWAATWWVSYLGNDANPGTEAEPFRNLRFAIGESAPGTFRPAYGDTVKVVPHPSADPDAYYDSELPTGSLDVIYNPNPTGTPNPYLTIISSVPGTMVYVRCEPRALVSNQIDTAPCYGSNGRSFIHWEWISPVASTQNGFVINNASNVRLYNATIDLGPRGTGGGNGNYWAISCNGTSGSFSSNFEFYNVTLKNGLEPDGTNTSAQTAGIGHFRCRNIHAHHFDIDRFGTGIDDKEGGQGNLYELGRITRTRFNALLVVALGDTSTNPNSNIDGVTFSQLLIVPDPDGSGTTGLKLNLGDGMAPRTAANITAKNLTIYNADKCLVSNDGNEYVTGVQFFNTICVVRTANSWQTYEVGSAMPWPDYLSDFNAYRVLGGVAQGFTTSSGVQVLGTQGGSGEWRDNATTAIAAGFLDLNSVTTDPAFPGGSLTYADPSTNWIPSVGSGLRSAGSATGLVGGAATWIGAFTSTTDQIGLEVAVATSPSVPRRGKGFGFFGRLCVDYGGFTGCEGEALEPALALVEVE